VIGVLADFTGMPERPLPQLRYRRFVPVDVAGIDDLARACSPHLAFHVENKLTDDSSRLRVDLHFRGMADFDPENVARQIAPLRALLEMRTNLAGLRDSLRGDDRLNQSLQDAVTDSGKLDRLRREVRPDAEPPAHNAEPIATPSSRDLQPPPRRTLREPPPTPAGQGIWSRRTVEPEELSPLDQLVESSSAIRTPFEKEQGKNLIREFVEQVLDGAMTVGFDTEGTINARLAEIDHLVSVQLSEVLHSPEFERLEATWRGLRYLLRSTRKAAGVEIRVLNISKKELWVQFRRTRDRHDDQLSRKVLEQAGGTLGAAAFGLLIGDYGFGRALEDAELMERMSLLGAAAHVPFVAAAAPDLLGLTDFADLVTAFRLGRVFDGDAYTKWRHFRARPESRYIGLVMPRMLLRIPYGKNAKRIESFDFEESGVDSRRAYLWGNAVWALAARIARDFDRYGWFGGNRDPADAGDVPELPMHTYQADDGIATAGPAEVAISDASYLELRSLGLIPLCQQEASSRATFFETWSVHKPRIDPDDEPPTTYESAEIDCILAVSRIAHYLRVLVRQHRQRFSSVQACEDFVRKWAASYVVPDYAKGSEYAAAFPLVDFQLRIVPASDANGMSRLEAAVRPRRAVGSLSRPVEISIPAPLPWALTSSIHEPCQEICPAITAESLAVRPVPTITNTHGATTSSGGASGREQFIRRIFMAETAITTRRLDIAVLILEGLAEQIDRHHLEEWESSKLVGHVWDLLRHCYQLTSSPTAADERCAALLRRICRIDPDRALG
jgi:type VI secretion system protein ImpC